MAWVNERCACSWGEMCERLGLRGDRSCRARAYGRVATLEKLREEVPEGLRVLVKVPGIGPRKARLIHERLGVATVEDLSTALGAGRLAGLPGMGERTEANLRRALSRMAAGGRGIPLAAALPVAESLRAQLARVPGVLRVELAGSLRRMKPVVHDMDLLATGPEPAEIARAFPQLPSVAELAAAGDTKVSIRTREGYQVDLRVVRPEVWGAALQYFTGSKEHNVKIRELAIKQGFKLSEYGLHTRDGELVVAEEEAVVYQRLGLQWVPPVLREDRGEVEAARAGELPRLVQLSEVGGDFHCHTSMSPDGTVPLLTMVEAARARGYRFLAITDHAERLSFSAATRDDFLRQREALRGLERRLGDIRLLHGVELNIGADGSLDYDDEFLDGFDVLVASVHDHFDLPVERQTERLVRACEHPGVNVIGHPTGRLLGKRPAYDVDVEALCAAAARTGTALEVNGSPERLDLGDEQLRVATRHAARLAFGSDSHGPGHLANMRFSVATAGRGWIGPEQVVNTLPAADLGHFLARGRKRP